MSLLATVPTRTLCVINCKCASFIGLSIKWSPFLGSNKILIQGLQFIENRSSTSVITFPLSREYNKINKNKSWQLNDSKKSLENRMLLLYPGPLVMVGGRTVFLPFCFVLCSFVSWFLVYIPIAGFHPVIFSFFSFNLFLLSGLVLVSLFCGFVLWLLSKTR